MKPTLSVIIPVGPGDRVKSELLSQLSELDSNDEIIIVRTASDSEVIHSTPEKLSASVQWLNFLPGRAKQQNFGALKAQKNFLWFLHADSELAPGSIQKLKSALLKKQNSIFYFDLKFKEKSSPLLSINEWGAYFRSNLLKMPFGDQGLALSHKTFFELECFDENAPYGEDHLLIWLARQKNIPILSLNQPLYTSARKYKKRGWFNTTVQHLFLTYKQAGPEFLKLIRSSCTLISGTFLRTQRNKPEKVAIAIFVKTPGVSQLKTRLAQTVGPEMALDFYRHALAATDSVISSLSWPVHIYWAVAEESCLRHDLWRSHPTLWQGHGLLGQKLSTIYKTLKPRYDLVCFIGADSPHITRDEYENLIRTALHSGERYPFTFGATEDGGFFFFSGQKNIPEAVWTSVEYSTEQTRSQLIQALEPVGQSQVVANSFDIDTESDLQAYRLFNQNKTESKYTSQQQQLFAWVQSL